MKRIKFEKVLPDAGSSFKAAINDCSYFTSPFHYHPEFEVKLIDQGDGLFFCGDYIGKFQPGDIGIFGKELPHLFLSDNRFFKEDSEEKCRSIYIQFNEDILPHEYKQMSDFKTIHHLLSKAERGIVLPSKGNSKLIELIHSLPEMQGFEKVTGLYTILNILGESSGHTVLASNNYRNSEISLDSACQKVLYYINTNYQQEITLEKLADVACMERTALCRKFKKVTGRTIIDFLNEIRIGHACQLITHTDLTISAIAYDCGFQNMAHFYSLFKAHTNHTPKSYRNCNLVSCKFNIA